MILNIIIIIIFRSVNGEGDPTNKEVRIRKSRPTRLGLLTHALENPFT
jgi:hypothetical protein